VEHFLQTIKAPNGALIVSVVGVVGVMFGWGVKKLVGVVDGFFKVCRMRGSPDLTDVSAG